MLLAGERPGRSLVGVDLADHRDVDGLRGGGGLGGCGRARAGPATSRSGDCHCSRDESDADHPQGPGIDVVHGHHSLCLGSVGSRPAGNCSPDGAGSCSDLIVVGLAGLRHRDLPHLARARSTHGLWVISASFWLRARVALLTMEPEVIRVVVVDDHALHRDGTRQILEAHPDLQVVGDASSGEIALALVNQLHPDVVLLDIRLPGMNGIEVARRLTRDHPDVRVLMVSAYDEDEYVRGALEAGAAGYLRKTAPGKELVQAVRAVAGGASVLQSGLTARLLISTRQPEQGAN